MSWLFESANRVEQHANRLEICESSGTAVIRIFGSLDVDAAREVHRFVASQADRVEVRAVEIDLREMDAWTSAGLREISACAGGQVRFRMGPHAGTTS
jgi:hypothetical protein